MKTHHSRTPHRSTDSFEKISVRIAKCESSIGKIEKSKDYDFEELEHIEDSLTEMFELLDEKEARLLQSDVVDAEVRRQLLECANLVSQCDRLWRRLKNMTNDSAIDYETDEADVWDMMYPDQDTDADDFELGFSED